MARAGDRIGRLTLLADTGSRANGYRVWRCRCDCGREEDIPGHRLRPGPKQTTACSPCRAPACRYCGTPLGGPTRRRTCSPECRRALWALLTQQSRARLSLSDPEYSARPAPGTSDD